MSPSPNRIYFGFFLFVFVVIAVLIIMFRTQKSPLEKIQSFDDCVKAGYPIMSSDIRMCTLPNGRFFVHSLVPEMKGK